ncbi:ribonuclease H-like domain-containing protein, partial [Tanacetum coccineum]
PRWWGGCCGEVAVVVSVVVMLVVKTSGGVWVVVAWWRRVEESGCGDRIDPVRRSVFGVGRKSPPEKFSGGGWPERGDGGRRISEYSINELLTMLLQQLGKLGVNATVSNPSTNLSPAVAFHPNSFTTPSPTIGPTPTYPSGFLTPAHVPHYYYPTGPSTAMAQHVQPVPPPQPVAYPVFMLFRTYVSTQFNCEIKSCQCDHGGEFDNRALHTLFAFKGMFLSQKKYAVEILERAGMVNCDPSRNPVDTESNWVIQRVCLHTHDPREPHIALCLRYFGLWFAVVLLIDTDLVAYLHADWAGCPTTWRSTSGYCVFLGNNLLSWSSKRQPTLSRFSAEAEYRGVSNVVAETCWLRNLLRELHTPLSFATLVYCDNVSAVYLSCNPVQHQRTKHIEIDIHFVRDLVVAGQVRVLHVPSRYQFVDIFTKGLPSALFEEFRSSLSVRSTPAQTAEC